MSAAVQWHDAQRYAEWRKRYHTQLDADGWRATLDAWQAASAGGRGDLVHTINELNRRIAQLEREAEPWALPEERVSKIIEAPVEQPTEDPHKVARIVLDRLRQVVRFVGDPQHPRWHAENRDLLADILSIVDPFRPELENDEVLEDDELWNKVYMMDPVDAYVAQSEKVAIDRANKLESAVEKMVRAGVLGDDIRAMLTDARSALEAVLEEGTFPSDKKGAMTVSYAQRTLQSIRRKLSE